MKGNFTKNITRMMGRTKLKLKKCSPEIMLALGIVGGIAAAVMACKATTKLDDILEDTADKVEQIHSHVEQPSDEISAVLRKDESSYTKEDADHDLTIVYVKTAFDIAKLYAPAVVLGTASIVSVIAGHRILSTRNAALAAAYAAVDKNFKAYRHRVVERFGKALDRELRFDIKPKEVEGMAVHDDGTESIMKDVINTATINECSDYAKFFDVGNDNWKKDPELNLLFLRRQQDWANDKLKSQGYLFLNDVYEMLGIDKTRIGQVTGWIYDEKNPVGDNYVDFGIYNPNSNANVRFVNGLERTILLDFNVDGYIIDRF